MNRNHTTESRNTTISTGQGPLWTHRDMVGQACCTTDCFPPETTLGLIYRLTLIIRRPCTWIVPFGCVFSLCILCLNAVHVLQKSCRCFLKGEYTSLEENIARSQLVEYARLELRVGRSHQHSGQPKVVTGMRLPGVVYLTSNSLVFCLFVCFLQFQCVYRCTAVIHWSQGQ